VSGQPELARTLTILTPFVGTPTLIPEAMRAVLGPDAVPTTWLHENNRQIKQIAYREPLTKDRSTQSTVRVII
jgi:hypothetical protein